MNAPLYVGLDVSHQTFEAVLLDRHGQRVGPRYHRLNQRPDAQAFADELVQHLHAGGFDTVLIGLEATHCYGWHLQDLLASYEPLQPFNPQSMCSTPAWCIASNRPSTTCPKPIQWMPGSSPNACALGNYPTPVC